MAPRDIAPAGPCLVPEEYFAGRLRAYGLFQDRLGRLRRQFVADVTGTPTATGLVLDERFLYADGAVDRRVWSITRIGPGRYGAEAAGVVGRAIGVVTGNALNWRYVMDLPVGRSTWRLTFDDWMILHSDGVLLNRASVRKWGVEIGTVSIAFVKPAPPAAAG